MLYGYMYGGRVEGNALQKLTPYIIIKIIAISFAITK